MKFTKSVRRWTIAAVAGLVGWYLVADTTLLFSYTISDGTTLSPSAAQGWCSLGRNTIGYNPPGCGRENAPVDFAVLLFIAGIVCAVVAIVKAVKAAKQES